MHVGHTLMLYSDRAACDFINQRLSRVTQVDGDEAHFLYLCVVSRVFMRECAHHTAVTAWEQIKAQVERGQTWFITKVIDKAKKNCLEIQMKFQSSNISILIAFFIS